MPFPKVQHDDAPVVRASEVSSIACGFGVFGVWGLRTPTGTLKILAFEGF